MKKSYLLILGISVTAFSYGQKKIVEKKPATQGLSVDVTSVKPATNLQTKAAGDVIYSETFNGSISNWTTSDVDAALWLFDTNGPDGQFSSTSNADIITSTTASNGFMIFDADLSNPSAPYTDRIGSLVSPVIDLTSNPSINIRFQHAYRTCCSSLFFPKLEVSTDGFNTFTTYDVTATGFGVNDFTGTVSKEVNISSFLSTASNLNNFQFRFNFDGIAGASSHYFWQIDDVQLIVPYDYSLTALLDYWGTPGGWGPRLPYNQVPVTQVAAIDYSVLVENRGGITQTDVTLTADIPEGPFNNTGAPVTITSGTVDTTNLSMLFTPNNTITTYNPTFTISSSNTDVDPLDNMLDGMPVIVNDSVYARDMGTADGGTYNTGQGYEAGNIFDLFADETVKTATFRVNSTSNVGAQVYARLYDLDPVTRDFRFMVETDAHAITAGELGTLITLSFQGQADLLADSSYLLVAGSYGDGGATNDFIVGTSGTSEPQTSYYFDMTDQTWYYTTSTPMVRLNVSISRPTVTSDDADNILCTGASLTLTSSSATGNVWSPNGETTQSITVNAAGTYSVTANGTSSFPVTVIVQAINNTVNPVFGQLVSNQAGASYQWLDCNNGNAPIPNETNQLFSPAANGNYAVTVTMNGCSATSNCFNVTNAGVVEENEAVSAFRVYPNPATENVTVDFTLKNESSVEMTITDLSGKTVYTSKLGKKTSGNHSAGLNTANLANGIYVLNFKTDQSVITEKLIIK